MHEGMAQAAPTIRGGPADAGRDRRIFLGVERSLSGRHWFERLDAAGSNVALAMAQRHQINDVVARVLAGRGVGVDEAPAFLAPSLKALLPDPSVLTDMDRAAERIADAVTAGERIAVFGDYDVDGASSAALLARFLRHQGLDAIVYIPDRLFEGYGPNVEALRALAGQGARLIVTVDCGSTSFDALAEAGKLGVDVVVIDHHELGAERPQAVALVNPNRQDDLSGLEALAAVGVTFMTVIAVNRLLRARGWYGASRPEPDLLQWLDLVALGTVCDVVPLTGLNRAFVAKGLMTLARRANRGIAALADVARLGGPVTPYHLGFRARAAHQCRRTHRRCGAGSAAAVHGRSSGMCADRRRARPPQWRAPDRWRHRRWRRPMPRPMPRSAAAKGRQSWSPPIAAGTRAWSV